MTIPAGYGSPTAVSATTPVALSEGSVPAPLAAVIPTQPLDLHRDADPYRVYLDGLGSPASRRTMGGCLDRLARLLLDANLDDVAVTGEGRPWWLLRAQHTQALRAQVLSQGWSPAHGAKHLAALRGVLRAAWRLGLMSTDEHARAVDLPPVRGSRLPAGRDVGAAELAALLDACADGSPGGARDAALIAAAYSSGMRRAEVIALDVADWIPSTRGLRVLGKGDKERSAFLAPWAAGHLAAWLQVRGRRRGPLFCPVLKSGRVIVERGLSGQAVADLLARRTALGGVAPCSPHDLRRTVAGDLLDTGADLATVQRLLGHASPATTSRYDRRADRSTSRAVAALRVPHARAADEGV
jgi:site-specific recombinase XerD